MVSMTGILITNFMKMVPATVFLTAKIPVALKNNNKLTILDVSYMEIHTHENLLNLSWYIGRRCQ